MSVGPAWSSIPTSRWCDVRKSDNEWLDDAACKGATGYPFFTNLPDESGQGGDSDGVVAARRYCDSCPVRSECILEAVHYEHGAEPSRRNGVWAGYTPAQRQSAERRNAISCAVCGATFDPALVRIGIVRCPVDKRHVDRVLPPIPDEGDQWSKRHTTLARRVLKHLDAGGPVPRPRRLSVEFAVREQDMARVFAALVLDGTLRRNTRGDYLRTKRTRRADPTTWLPPHQVR